MQNKCLCKFIKSLDYLQKSSQFLFVAGNLTHLNIFLLNIDILTRIK